MKPCVYSLWTGCVAACNVNSSEDLGTVVGVCQLYHSVHGGCFRGKEAKEETLTGMEITAHGSACLWRDRLIINLEQMVKKYRFMRLYECLECVIKVSFECLCVCFYPSRPRRNSAGMLGLAVLPSVIISRY